MMTLQFVFVTLFLTNLAFAAVTLFLAWRKRRGTGASFGAGWAGRG